MGYHRAGFDEIVGVDIKPQPRYPFEFVQGDALEYLAVHGREFDVIHASPPCQAYSVTRSMHDNNYPDLVADTRLLLQQTNRPYIIENVPGAPLQNPITLCGSMFYGLRVKRHRLFECNPPVYFAPATCRHPLHYTRDRRKSHYGKLSDTEAFVQVTGGGNCSIAAAADAMGIDWMTKAELNQAIPPAYTEWLGKQIIRQLEATQ